MRAADLETVSVVVPVVAVALLAALAYAAFRGRLIDALAAARANAEKRRPPGPGQDVTLVLTDVQGSTELWEWDTEVAAEAFALHDRVLRQHSDLADDGFVASNLERWMS